jgi:hypothetical protein
MKSTIALGDHLEIVGEVSGPGSVGGVEIAQTLTPDNDAVPGAVSGDAFAFTLRPTVNISPHSNGPMGTNAHKWVGTLRMYMPKLQGGGGTGKPQSLVGIMLLDPPGTDTLPEDAWLEAWALVVGTKLGIKIDGLVQVGSLRIAKTFTPTSSADPRGKSGDVCRDANYLYLKDEYTWKRTRLETWQDGE